MRDVVVRRSLGRLTLLGALAVALAVPAPRAAEAGDMPSKRYRDPNAKFSFRIFDDWDPVPVEAEGKMADIFGGVSKYTVVKYMQRGADKRGREAAQLHAYRRGTNVAGQGGGNATTPGDSGDSFEKKLRELASKDDPKSMKEVFDKVLESYGFPGFLDAKQAKKIKSKDGVEGQFWSFERRPEWMPADWGSPYLLSFAAWKKGDMELGLWMYAPGEQKKKFMQGFEAVAKSFLFFDPQAEDVRSLSELDGLRISAKKRRTIERGLVKGWDVHVSPFKNYIIVYNTKGKRNDLLAKIIAERIEAIRAQIYERIFPPAAPIEAVSIVRICGDQAEYHAYGGPGGSAGYWSSDTEELVFYDASPKKAPDDDTVSVLYHEAFHQYIYYSVGEVAPHSWFNEGTGDYFAGARYSGGKFTIKPFRWRTETIKKAIRTGAVPVDVSTDSDGDTKLKFDWSVEGYVPLNAFIRMTQREYYGPNVMNCYAQGWAFNYFLREAVPKNPKWNEKWGKILPTYFDVLKAEVNKEKPLAPKKEDPAGPGMGKPDDEPGDDEPPAPPPSDPGMDPNPPPGMDDPGMGDPPPPGGMGEDGDGDEPDPTAIVPRFFRESSEKALKKAVEEAFRGVDLEELEKCWREFTLKVGK